LSSCGTLVRAQDSSPAPLRLAVRAVAEGVALELIKRKGSAALAPIMVKLFPSPNLISGHRRVLRRKVELPAPAVVHAAITE
jgi:protein ImuA